MTTNFHPARDRHFLGFPLSGFGLFTSLLLTFSTAFFTFFLVTTVAIFSLLAYNLLGHHSANYADSYRIYGLPAALVMLVIAAATFGTLWFRAHFGHAPSNQENN